jgi:hypothetical protein
LNRHQVSAPAEHVCTVEQGEIQGPDGRGRRDRALGASDPHRGPVCPLQGDSRLPGLRAAGPRAGCREINAAGSPPGRPVELRAEDEKSPTHAAEVVRRMARELGVRLLVGINFSAVAEAVVPLLPDLQCVLMITHAASPHHR